MSLPSVARSAGNIQLRRRLVAFACAALLCTSTAWADGISGTVGGPVGLWVNTTDEALYISTSGNVGIGTTVPTVALQVGPNGSSAGNIVIGSNSGASNPPLGKIDWVNSAGGTWDVGSIEVDGDAGTGDYGSLVFKTGEATGTATEKMRINYAGNVGIGTTPQSKLQVAGRETLDDAGNFELMANHTYNGTSDNYLNTGFGGRIEYNDSVGSWLFETATSGTAGATITETTRMTILNGGNVGIGTTGPLAGLDSRPVVGATTAMFGYGSTGVAFTENYPAINFNSYNNGSNNIYMGTGYAAIFQQNPSTGEMQLFITTTPGTAGATVASSITPLNITTSGYVGIGTAGPGSLLEVNGTTQLDSTTTITGTLNQTGNAVLSGTTTFTGAMNATALSSGTIAAGKYIGLNSSNQLVLASASAGATVALSSITSAQATNSEDNAAYAQTWTWNSISTQTGLTISSSSALTGGTLVNLSDSAASATSTGYVLSVSNSTTGKGYSGYFAMTGSGNTGYAGYFIDTGTGAAGYAIYTSGANYLGGTTTVAGAFNTTSTNILGGTTTITGTLNQTGNAVLSGTTTISTGALNITSNAILSGTTTFTGAMNATNIAGGTVASGKFIGLNSNNQLVTSLASGGVASNMALSGLTSAQATNSEDNAAYAQTWTWNSISTQTGLTISTTSPLTGGTLVSLSDSAASATSTGKILSISNSTTGAGYALYATMTASSNAGYAVYGANAGTSGTNYGVYGSAASANGLGVYGTNSAVAGIAVEGVVSSGAAVGVFGTTSSTTTNSFGVEGTATNTGTVFGGYFTSTGNGTGAAAVYGSDTGTGTDYGGYFITAGVGTGAAGLYGSSTGTSGTNYGVEGVNASSGGYGGYFTNSSSGVGGYFSSSSGYALITSTGNVGIGSASPGSLLTVNGTTALGGTTTITGTLNQTGNAVLSGTTTISTGALNITSNAILSGTTTFTGAMNATGLSSGSIASGKYIGLSSTNQLVLASATAGATIALSSITSAQATNSEDNAAYAQTWTWNTISTQTGLTISTTAALTGGTLVSLSDSAASATSTGKILSISNSTTGAGYDGYFTMTATGNQGYAIYATNTGPKNKGYAIYGLNNSTSGWGEYQAGSSPNYFDGAVGIGTTSPNQVLEVNGNIQVDGGAYIGPVNLGNQSQEILYGTYGSTNAGLQFASSNSGYVGEFQFSVGDGSLFYEASSNSGSSWSTLLDITQAGNVGIGTNAPDVNSNTSTLTINTSGSATQSQIDLDSGGVNEAGVFGSAAQSGMYGPNWAFYGPDGYLYIDGYGNTQIIVGSGSSLGGPTADPPLWTSASLSDNTSGTGFISYYSYNNPVSSKIYPGVLTQITAVKNTTGYGTTEGTLSWVDAPASDTNYVNAANGAEGLLTFENTQADNWGGTGLDGEAYTSGTTYTVIGVSGSAELDTGTNYGNIVGGTFYGLAFGGATAGLQGADILVQNGGGYGGAATITPDGMDGIDVILDSAGGSVTGDMDGIYVEPDITGGTVDDRYGIFIAAGAGAPTGSDYGVYQESATAQNYFAGGLTVGPAVAGSSSTNVLTTNGYTASQILLDSIGCCWGTLQNDTSTNWSLGYTSSFSTALGTPVLSWTTGGKVGIGTSSPGTQLEVGSQSSSASQEIEIASGNGSEYRTWGIKTIYGGATTTDPNYGFDIRDENSGTDAFFISFNTHDVGINTTTPGYTLDVNGEIHVGTLAAGSGTSICRNGNVLSSCSSSIRYKENVKAAPFGLKDVMEMRPVTFKWKGRDENDIGFIAEEMEKVNPLFVNYEHGQVEGVKYPQLTSVLTNAIKEQQAEIDSLKAANDKLRARIEKLEAAHH